MSTGAPPPTPAATVAPIRDGRAGLEVLLLQRNGRGQFGGMWVFPGGQVDAADLVAPGGAELDEVAGARRAAVREAREEAGLDLDADTLVVHSWWLPPPEAPRRFATWFFLAPVGEAAVEVDGVEILDWRWAVPGAALADRDRGAISLAAPTWMTLWWLSRQPGVSAALAAAGDPARRVPRYESHAPAGGSRRVVMWEGDAGWDARDPDAPGPRRRLWMDPEGWRVEVTEGEGAGPAGADGA